jgi:4-amino-4-deoxy-L-arabinose transferase-like glycosyltransferase
MVSGIDAKTMPKKIMPALDRILSGFASVFEITPQPGARRSWEIFAVVAILLGAAWVRFWGLGGWGLEGDEDTMALPAVHILRYGTSYLPSGMFYARGIAQLYMMAASMMTFGESEWAMRFPSVICGLLVVALAYFYGRRFLAPVWNIAFVASLAFLPASIADSQEARMYIFLSACLTAYTILIFEWERTNRIKMLVAAVAVMIIGLQFHALAVFGAFLVSFFIPACCTPIAANSSRASWRSQSSCFAMCLLADGLRASIRHIPKCSASAKSSPSAAGDWTD